ncbi:hypothetical protein IBX65_08520 [Candidatus Aerophobetes bacterium]|nr:hypothetical protein [Candidatus Aerophobetes bacterium]
MSKREKESVDAMSIIFSRAIKIGTWIGLAVMILFGLLYLVGINSYLDISCVANHWEKPATLFWQEVKGVQINDYSWFLLNLSFMDSLSMIGIFLLALTPLISVLLMIPKAQGIYKVFLSILTAELAFCIIIPIL